MPLHPVCGGTCLVKRLLLESTHPQIPKVLLLCSAAVPLYWTLMYFFLLLENILQKGWYCLFGNIELYMHCIGKFWLTVRTKKIWGRNVVNRHHFNDTLKNDVGDWGYGLLSKALTTQAWGPEFGLSACNPKS